VTGAVQSGAWKWGGAEHREKLRQSELAEYVKAAAKESLWQCMWDYLLPVAEFQDQEEHSLAGTLLQAVLSGFPVYTYAAQQERETVQAEDVALEAEPEQEAEPVREAEAAQEAEQALEGMAEEQTGELMEQLLEENEASVDGQTETVPASFFGQFAGEDMAGPSASSLFSYATEKQAELDLEELADYETLVKQHYCIDGTTSTNKKQLNLTKLLKKDLTLTEDVDGPQILIYHTHGQEGYSDSREGKKSESVIGLGDYLTELLQERYGLQVLHDRNIYDTDRDRAYSVAGPALEETLEKYPSIEVVIDLHRDGVASDTYLVTEVNDTRMAPVMFFNGLSYTKASGALDSLKNPNLSANLAFSLQMELLASEYYPGFSRGIYLKGLRYNLHYCPKSLLVEVGAQTNTLKEAMNAMPPLADLLNRALTGEKP
jgi:stage II sporulation protein P